MGTPATHERSHVGSVESAPRLVFYDHANSQKTQLTRTAMDMGWKTESGEVATDTESWIPTTTALGFAHRSRFCRHTKQEVVSPSLLFIALRQMLPEGLLFDSNSTLLSGPVRYILEYTFP